MVKHIFGSRDCKCPYSHSFLSDTRAGIYMTRIFLQNSGRPNKCLASHIGQLLLHFHLSGKKQLHSPSFISWFSSLFSEWCLRLWASCHTLAPKDGPLIFSKLKNPLLDAIKLRESEKGCLPSDSKYCEAVGNGLSFNPALEISVGKQRSIRIKLAPAWEHG